MRAVPGLGRGEAPSGCLHIDLASDVMQVGFHSISVCVFGAGVGGGG
jgi:hypothetical protein